MEKLSLMPGLSIRRGGLVEKRGFRRELSTETGLFVEKLRLMLGFSAGRLDFMEIKTLKKYSVMSFEFITECFSEWDCLKGLIPGRNGQNSRTPDCSRSYPRYHRMKGRTRRCSYSAWMTNSGRSSCRFHDRWRYR